MSWIKENYEKAALGGAAVIALAVGGLTVLGGGEEVSSAKPTVKANDETNIPELVSLAKVMNDRSESVVIREKSVDLRGNIDLFVGQPLYKQRDNAVPVDLLGGVDNVHKGIKNEFFIKYGIDLSYADSPERDHDGDGFTNREEYEAGTLPNDASQYPNPISKLAGDEVKTYIFRLRWSEFDQDVVTIDFQDFPGKRLGEQASTGDVVFNSEPVKGRFKLGKRSTVEDSDGNPDDVYEIEDLKANYKGQDRSKIQLPKNGKFDGWSQFEDRSIVLHLNALGKEDETFELEEFSQFSLPFDPKAKEKPYTLKAINPIEGKEGVYEAVIEYEEGGETKPYTIEAKVKK